MGAEVEKRKGVADGRRWGNENFSLRRDEGGEGVHRARVEARSGEEKSGEERRGAEELSLALEALYVYNP